MRRAVQLAALLATLAVVVAARAGDERPLPEEGTTVVGSSAPPASTVTPVVTPPTAPAGPGPDASPTGADGSSVAIVGDFPPEARPYWGYHDRLGWYVPDYVKVQTGGFLGGFTAVVGYAFWVDRINFSLQYGYMPPRDNAPQVQIFSSLLTFRPLRIDVGPSLFAVPLYVGGGAMLAKGPNLFISQPAVYPKGYYPPPAFQVLALVGLEIGARGRQGDILTRQSVFFELVTINQYLDAVISNKNFKFFEALSSAVGYRASF